MAIRLRLYTTEELKENCNGLKNVFHIKVEISFIEKITDDGRYYDFNSLNKLKKAVRALKDKYEKYKKVIIIDEEGLMNRNKP